MKARFPEDELEQRKVCIRKPEKEIINSQNVSNPSKMWIPLLISSLILAAEGAPQVSTTWGDLRGKDIVSPQNVTYYGYLGIPYAVAPIGEFRFSKPQPHPGYSETFNATEYGPGCPQKDSDVSTSEDCLILNVYVPENASSTRQPKAVIVWIHGGGFHSGEAVSFDPWHMVTNGDVIVVIIQYRLGVLGFLSTGDDLIPGNYGLWDQRLAILWVKDNIAGFGGDPENITVAGDSAGAACVVYQTLNPSNRGLFQKVILQSGSASASWAIKRKPLPNALEFARTMGCLRDGENYSSNKKEMLSCLREKTTEEMIANAGLQGSIAAKLTRNDWAPTVDHDFILKQPSDALTDKDFLNRAGFYNYDYLVGFNNNEGGLLLDFTGSTSPDSSFLTVPSFYDNELLPNLLSERFGERVSPDVKDFVSFSYTFPRQKDKPLVLQHVLDTYSDILFVAPSVEVARAHAEGQNDGKTYMYHFDHYPNNSSRGMSHGADEYYLIGMDARYRDEYGFHGNFSAEEHELSNKFMGFITEFAKSSEPNNALSTYLTTTWPEYTVNQEAYLAVTINMEVRQHVYPKRVSLVLDFLPKLQERWLTEITESPSSTSTAAPPCSEQKLRLFQISTEVADYLLLGLIVGICLLLIVSVVATALACRRHSQTDKYGFA